MKILDSRLNSNSIGYHASAADVATCIDAVELTKREVSCDHEHAAGIHYRSEAQVTATT